VKRAAKPARKTSATTKGTKAKTKTKTKTKTKAKAKAKPTPAARPSAGVRPSAVTKKPAPRADLGAPVDGFFARQPPHLRPVLDELRALVAEAAPDAESSIK